MCAVVGKRSIGRPFYDTDGRIFFVDARKNRLHVFNFKTKVIQAAAIAGSSAIECDADIAITGNDRTTEGAGARFEAKIG